MAELTIQGRRRRRFAIAPERVRETFGKYIDPRVVEGLIDRLALTAAEGQRRVMTVLFCGLQGFTSLSEGMTPQDRRAD